MTSDEVAKCLGSCVVYQRVCGVPFTLLFANVPQWIRTLCQLTQTVQLFGILLSGMRLEVGRCLLAIIVGISSPILSHGAENEGKPFKILISLFHTDLNIDQCTTASFDLFLYK